jgi:ATP-dependent RNA helicase DDX60
MDSTHIAFDDTVDSSQDNPAPAHEEKMNAVEALKCIDDRWYKTVAGKKARWMDLIGDYAGNERFTLDGNKTLVWFSRI